MGSGICSCLLSLGRNNSMAELREAHLRYLLAKDMLQCIELIRERLPAMGFDLTEEETRDFVRTMVVNLPEHCRRRLAGRV